MTAIPVRAGRHRYQVHAPVGDHIGEAIRASGMPYERDLLRVLAPFVRPRTAVVDVGANIGNHALYFAITRGAVVHAFEPNPESRHYLHESLEANQVESIYVHPEALSDHRGAASLIGADDLGMISFAPDPAGDVRLAILDDFKFPLQPRIAVLKIDVEGAEAAILDGARKTLEEHRPLVAVEAPTRSDRREVESVLPAGYRRLPVRFGWTPTYVYFPRLFFLLPLLPIAVYARAAQLGK